MYHEKNGTWCQIISAVVLAGFINPNWSALNERLFQSWSRWLYAKTIIIKVWYVQWFDVYKFHSHGGPDPNINAGDVQRKNVVNNVDKSIRCLVSLCFLTFYTVNLPNTSLYSSNKTLTEAWFSYHIWNQSLKKYEVGVVSFSWFWIIERTPPNI